jgi:hypothetical protein
MHIHQKVVSTCMKNPYIRLNFLMLVETLHIDQKVVSTCYNGLIEKKSYDVTNYLSKRVETSPLLHPEEH